MVFRCVVIFLFFFTQKLSAQFFSLGQNPSATKWSQINTSEFQLIFPNDFENEAQRLANILSYANEVTRDNLKSKPRKISIILQNNASPSNSNVTLAPKRSEFYATPSQENEGVDWLKKLAVHEYRHVIQFEKYNEGAGKLLYTLFGEQGIGALLLATTPLWFIEGDAVHSESNHTERGRANYPAFTREMLAQVAELDSLSYDKASFGSFKNFITNHYKLGYYFQHYVRENYGVEVWDSVLTRVIKRPLVPYPFSYHLKKVTGKTSNQLYGDLYSYLNNEVRKALSTFTFPQQRVVTPAHDDYVSYESPIYVSDSSFIAVGTSYNHPPRIVRFSHGKEQILHVPAGFDKNTFNFRKGKLVWVEKRRHPRWQYLDYSEVIVFDVEKRKRQRVRRKTRWFAPAFNLKGDSFVAIEVDKVNRFYLIVANLKGEVLRRVLIDKGQAYHPNWYNKNKIVFSNLVNGASSLMTWDLSTGELTQVSQTYGKPLSYPTKYKNGFLVKTIYKQKDIIAFIESGNESSVFSVVEPEFGLDLFAVAGSDSILFADYHNNGSRIVKTELKIGDLIKLGVYENKEQLQIEHKLFKVGAYLALANLFNFHSWAPFSVRPQTEEVGLGASLFSQNLLGSSIFGVNYDYGVFNRSQLVNVRYDFKHFYPNFFTEVNQLWEPFARVQGVSTNIQTSEVLGGANIDLLFNGGKLIKRLFLQGDYIFSESNFKFEGIFRDTVLTTQNVRFLASYIISHRRGRRDVFSPFSFTINGSLFNNITSEQNAIACNSNLTFKGFLKNDGFRVRAGAQSGTDVFVPNYLQVPRGEVSQRFERGAMMGFEYGLNIGYPDWKFGRLAYLQRVWAIGFYDYFQTRVSSQNQYLSSVGGTLYFDVNPFRYSYLNTFGVTIGQLRSGAFFYGPSWRVNY